MKNYLALLACALFMVSTDAWAAASHITASFTHLPAGQGERRWQAVRCEDGGTGNTPGQGEPCEAGDWTNAMDCRDYPNVSVTHFDYSDAGSSDVKVWNCLALDFPDTDTTDGDTDPTILGSEAPGLGNAADPDPLCVDLSSAVTIDGTASGVQYFSLQGVKLDHIVIEVDACTTCDTTTIVQCGE